jgi:hypothetical protein
MMRSLRATMYQDGIVRQAGTPDLPAPAASVAGRWVTAITPAARRKEPPAATSPAASTCHPRQMYRKSVWHPMPINHTMGLVSPA